MDRGAAFSVAVFQLVQSTEQLKRSFRNPTVFSTLAVCFVAALVFKTSVIESRTSAWSNNISLGAVWRRQACPLYQACLFPDLPTALYRSMDYSVGIFPSWVNSHM